MTDKFKVYYVEKFPFAKLNTLGEEPWVKDPTSLRNRYRYLEAIIEHINNDICEPIQVMQSGNQYLAGPHGANRLYAIYKLTEETHFPAVISCKTIPDFLEDPVEIKDIDDLSKYFHRDIKNITTASVNFADDGRLFFNTWGSFSNPMKLFETFKASPETTSRIAELFAIESMHSGSYDYTNTSVPDELFHRWVNAYKTIFEKDK